MFVVLNLLQHLFDFLKARFKTAEQVQQHGKPAQVHGGRAGWVAFQHALELDREADAEQQREQAVELAGEQHVPQLLGPLVHGAVPQV